MAGFADVHLDPGMARALQRGDRRAQAVAYRVMSPTIMGMAVRILQDEGLAQEVVQDTFVDLIDKAATLQDPNAVVGWVRRVAINHCYMRLRSPWHKRRAGEASLPEQRSFQRRRAHGRPVRHRACPGRWRRRPVW
jgi:DNA-directed RNA polymerase specialized sigma24 family protein